MEEWREYRLGDVCTISSSKRIFANEYQKTGIPFYRGKEIIEKQSGTAVSNELFISEDRYNEIKNKYGAPEEGDMLLSSVGTLGVPYIVQNETFYFKDGNLTWFYDYKGINNYFLYYWFLSPKARFLIDTKAIGSTQKALTIETLKKFVLLLPPIETQSKIVSILKSLDDKIEVNRRINENLEQQAQALFKSWFVDFEPFKNGEFVESELGMIPKGWRIVSLNDACIKVTDGSHYSPKDDPHGTIPMLSVKDMLHNGFDYSSCKKINEEEYLKMKSNDCVPLKDDILVAKDGSYLKEIFICNEEIKQAILSSIAIFRPNSDVIYPAILLQLLRTPNVKKDVGDNYVSGSALPRIVLKDFKKFAFVVAPLEIQNKLLGIMQIINNRIYNNNKESRRLAQLRDTLLPRLMSGELKVNEIENVL